MGMQQQEELAAWLAAEYARLTVGGAGGAGGVWLGVGGGWGWEGFRL